MKDKSNYYFDEEYVSNLILEWQKINQQALDSKEKGDTENYEKLKKISKETLTIIMEETYKVIKGVIFRAQFHKRERFDTCFQIAIEACIKALPRFNPEYGTAFNYLSLTAKRSIIYYLMKKAKKRKLSLDYEYMDEDSLKLKNYIHQEENTIRSLEIDNLYDSIANLITLYGNQNKNLYKVNDKLKEYLFYHKGNYNKKDFFKWSKADGISSNLLRKFTKFIKDNKEKLYNEVGVY